MECRKILHASVEKAAAPDFDARFILSASTPDRVNDTIDPAAYDKAAKSSEKLVALFNHDPDRPVGYWTKLARAGDTLTGYIKFASTNLGKMLKQLLADGVPLGASIGFMGKGERNQFGGLHFKEITILETSIVSSPAHPRAVEIAKSFNIPLAEVKAPQGETAVSGALLRARRAIIHAKRITKDQ
jgi:HK97 family phage prohead protease